MQNYFEEVTYSIENMIQKLFENLFISKAPEFDRRCIDAQSDNIHVSANDHKYISEKI